MYSALSAVTSIQELLQSTNFVTYLHFQSQVALNAKSPSAIFLNLRQIQFYYKIISFFVSFFSAMFLL